jgi:general stress protein YciG
MAKEDRGFASMDRAKQREIASKGGKAAHQKGTAHEWTSEEARDAGRKGGIASHQRRREQKMFQHVLPPSSQLRTNAFDYLHVRPSGGQQKRRIENGPRGLLKGTAWNQVLFSHVSLLCWPCHSFGTDESPGSAASAGT